MGSTAVTDDRGEYRAWGLPPGGYLVLAVPPSSSGRSYEPIRQPNSPVRVDYAPVFHPGATDIRAASTVALGLGEEPPGVDVAIQLVPTATISGTITSTSGALPQMLVLGLVPAGSHTEMLAGAGLRGPECAAAARRLYVLVFSADRRHWTPGSRRVRMIRPGTDGSYSMKGLPAGEYVLAAPTDLETGEWDDPVLLEQLVRSAARITLRDGEMATQDFRVGGA